MPLAGWKAYIWLLKYIHAAECPITVKLSQDLERQALSEQEVRLDLEQDKAILELVLPALLCDPDSPIRRLDISWKEEAL